VRELDREARAEVRFGCVHFERELVTVGVLDALDREITCIEIEAARGWSGKGQRDRRVERLRREIDARLEVERSGSGVGVVGERMGIAAHGREAYRCATCVHTGQKQLCASDPYPALRWK
jgi:hypothetical protein